MGWKVREGVRGIIPSGYAVLVSEVYNEMQNAKRGIGRRVPGDNPSFFFRLASVVHPLTRLQWAALGSIIAGPFRYSGSRRREAGMERFQKEQEEII